MLGGETATRHPTAGEARTDADNVIAFLIEQLQATAIADEARAADEDRSTANLDLLNLDLNLDLNRSGLDLNRGDLDRRLSLLLDLEGALGFGRSGLRRRLHGHGRHNDRTVEAASPAP